MNEVATAGTHEQACLNCGTALIGSHCHQCGQVAHVHRTLGAFVHDLLHGVFHFEGTIWRTLPLLVINPGKLTREYIAGKRASYVSPLALFLFCVFLMFAVIGSVGPRIAPDVHNGEIAKARDEVAQGLAQSETRVAELERTLAARPEDPAMRARLEGQLAAARKARDEARSTGELVGALSGVSQPNLKLDIDTGSAAFDHHVREAMSDPKLLLFKMQTKAYKFAWVLIPLSLPFMWLLFINRRRQFGAYDYAVFVTYSLCAMSLLLILGVLLAALGLPTGWLLLLVPVYFFIHLRGSYGLSTGSALLRTVALLAIAALVTVIATILLLLLGVMS